MWSRSDAFCLFQSLWAEWILLQQPERPSIQRNRPSRVWPEQYKNLSLAYFQYHIFFPSLSKLKIWFFFSHLFCRFPKGMDTLLVLIRHMGGKKKNIYTTFTPTKDYKKYFFVKKFHPAFFFFPIMPNKKNYHFHDAHYLKEIVIIIIKKKEIWKCCRMSLCIQFICEQSGTFMSLHQTRSTHLTFTTKWDEGPLKTQKLFL